MTEHIASVLINSLCSDGLIEEKDKEIYHYSIQVLIEKIIGFSVIIILSIRWGMLLETILFLLCFSGIRKHTGGYHAKSFMGCLIISIGIYITYVKFIFQKLSSNIDTNMILLVIATMLILAIGAVNHPNMDWSKKEHSDSKMISRITVVIEVTCIIVFYFLGMEERYILFMSFGVILSAFLLVLGKIVGQEVKCE